MTAPSRAREDAPVYFGGKPGRKYIDELVADARFAPDARGLFEAPSVTTILGAGLPTSWPIRQWDREVPAAYAVDNRPAWENLRLPDGSFDRQAAIDLIAGAARRTLGRAGDRGTDVHAIFEALGKGLPIPAIGPGREPWVQAVQQFWVDFRPVPVMVECSVYNRGRVPYAGTFDLIAWLPTGPGGKLELWLIDLKTGKDVYGNMAYQQMAYLDADYAIAHRDEGPDERVGIPEVERIGILNARENGSYNLVTLCETAGLPDHDKRAHALAVFYKAYGIWADLKAEQGLRGAEIPVPGRLEVQLYASWLMERGKALFAKGPHAIGLVMAMWPKDGRGVPIPGFTNPELWTAAHCEVIDERLTFVESELAMPFSPPPTGQRTGTEVVAPGAQLLGQPDQPQPDAFEGLPTYQVPVGTTVVEVGPLEGDATAVAEALRQRREGDHPGPDGPELRQRREGDHPGPDGPDLPEATADAIAGGEPERTVHDYVEAIDGQNGHQLGHCVCGQQLEHPCHGGYRPEPVTALGMLAAASGQGTAQQLPPVGPWSSSAVVGRPHHAGRWLTAQEEAQVRQRGSFTLEGVEVTPSFVVADSPGVLRSPAQEEHYRAQLARLASGGVTEAPDPLRSPDTGLTQRDAELFAQHRGAVLDIVPTLPIDLQRRLDAWSQSSGVGNIRSLRPGPDGLRAIELAHLEAMAYQREHQGRVAKLEAVLQGLLADQPGTWGWLAAIAVSGDGHLEDGPGALWEPSTLTGPQCVVVEALAKALGDLLLFMSTPDGSDTPTVLAVNLEAAKAVGKRYGDAQAVRTAAKMRALELGLPQRPSTQQAVYSDPILVALLGSPS